MGVEQFSEGNRQDFSPVEIDLTGPIPFCDQWETALDDAASKFSRGNVVNTEGRCAGCNHRIVSMNRDGTVKLSAPSDCAQERFIRRHGIAAFFLGKWKPVKPKTKRR